jgi:hypothetical protein
MDLKDLEKVLKDPEYSFNENGFRIFFCVNEERFNTVYNGKNAQTLKATFGVGIVKKGSREFRTKRIEEFVEDYSFNKDRKDRERTLKEINEIIKI